MLCSEFDPNPHAIINPEDLIQPIPGFPEICVMVFSNHIAEMCLRRWGGEHIAQVKCCVGDMPIYRVIVDGTEVALSTPYVGGPAAASFIEEVWPLGGKYFVFFGAAGVLDRNIPLNSFILPTAAVRDEGLSYHYLPPAEEWPWTPPVWMPAGERWRVWPALYPGQNLDHRRLLSRDSGQNGAPQGAGLRVRGDGVRFLGGGGSVSGGSVRPVFLHHRQFGRSCVGQRRAGTARGLCGRGMYRRRRGNGETADTAINLRKEELSWQRSPPFTTTW